MSHPAVLARPPQPMNIYASPPVGASVQVVTPELAKEWLSPPVHVLNRTIVRNRVDYFTHLIESGQFGFTGEPIQFSGWLANGTAQLRNGQHRLAAIARTGRPQTMLVVEGIDPGMMPYLDTGAKRSFADVLTLDGVSNSHTFATIIRLHYVLADPKLRKDASSGRFPTVSFKELQIWYRGRADAIRDGQHVGRRLRTAFHSTDAAGAVAWLLIREHTAADPAEVDMFFDRLAAEGPTGVQSGESRASRGEPMDRLRRWLTRQVLHSRGRQRPRSLTQTAILVKGWNAHREGQPVGLFSWTPVGAFAEDFPEAV